MDLGECPQIHDLALRADYEAAQRKKDHFYDIDVSNRLLHSSQTYDYPVYLITFINYLSDDIIHNSNNIF